MIPNLNMDNICTTINEMIRIQRNIKVMDQITLDQIKPTEY